MSKELVELVYIEPEPIVGHAHTAPYLDMVATRKIQFFIIAPPRGINVHTSHTVLIIGYFTVHQIWDKRRPARPSGVVQVLSDHIAAIAQSIWVLRAFGI